jgi:hypothetical protein
MKKYFWLLFVVCTLVSCEKKVDNSEIIVESNDACNEIYIRDYYKDDVHYKIFTTGRGGIAVINYTIDSIEISNMIMQ